MSANGSIDPAASLGALVAERPARASVFEALRLDYCCGGGQTLAQACAKRGLEIDTVRSAILALEETSSQDPRLEDRDWRGASLAELCARIVTVHHDGLREALPRIEALLCTVVRVHGGDHPELPDLHRAFAALRAQLEPHLASEEDELFLLPRVRKLAARARETGCDGARRVDRRGDEPPEPLPRCCQAWIAEQSRAWR